jgi:hypothetical protein
MRLSITFVATLLLAAVHAEKCACYGGTANSKRACDAIGKIYGVTGCGFTGCCVHKGAEHDSFVNKCNELGYGFLQCDDCPDC